MALPSSGPLTLADIQTEFGGTNPIGLSEYYAGGGLVPVGTTGTNGAVPSSGALSIWNFYGTTAAIPFGEATYTTAGTYIFVVPAGVSTICAVCVGGGASGGNISNLGGAGGGLSYSNGIPVTAGESLSVIVGEAGVAVSPFTSGVYGGDSSISRGPTVLLLAQGGKNVGGSASAGVGAVRYSGGTQLAFGYDGGGSGAAGYSGNGGQGAGNASGPQPTAGSGGGGGGGGSSINVGQRGGGVGLIVEGASGAAGRNSTPGPVAAGGAGSGGSGGLYGAGGGRHGDAATIYSGYVGGVRIIYGGINKNYPNNSAP